MKNLFFCILAAMVLASCGAKMHPVPSPDVTLDPKENSLSAAKEWLRAEVKVAPQSHLFYGMEDTFIIFFAKIENTTDAEVQISPEDFMLFDDKRHQSSMLKAEEVAKIVEQNLFYLIPYPYIGYYSESMNYYEGRYLYNPSAPHTYPVSPREVYLQAMPLGKIAPKAHVKGKLYFKKRLSEAKSLVLKIGKKGGDYLMNFNYDVK